MTKQMKLIVAVAAVVLLALIVYSTFQQTAHEYEVCVNFKGQSHCATAAGRTREEAIAAAHQIGCTLLTGNRDDNMVCLATAPASVRKITK